MNRILAVLLATLLLLPTLARAELKKGVELTSIAEVETTRKNDKGVEEKTRVLASTKPVPPGDTVIFTISYVNNGDQPATDILINNPIPENMIYQDNSAEGTGSRIDFSTDRGKSYGQIVDMKVTTETGKEKPAKAEDVTNVRWILNKPLPAGGKGSVSYRAKVK